MDKNGKSFRKIEITKTDSRSNRKYEQSVVKNLSPNNTPRPGTFTSNFQQTLREGIIIKEKEQILSKIGLINISEISKMLNHKQQVEG